MKELIDTISGFDFALEFSLINSGLLLLITSFFISSRSMTLCSAAVLLLSYIAINITEVEINDTIEIVLLGINDDLIFFSSILVLLKYFTGLKENKPGAIDNSKEINVLVLFLTATSRILTKTEDFLSWTLALEMQSLIAYILIVIVNNSYLSSAAAIKYFISSSMMSAVGIFGISLFYGATNSLSFTNINLQLVSSSPANSILLFIGILLVIANIFSKLSIAPFHFSTPEIYKGTSPLILILLTSVQKLPALTLLCKILMLNDFGEIFVYNTISVLSALKILFGSVGLLSTVLGTYGCLRQISFKKSIGYSTIFNSGFAIIAMPFAPEVAVFYLAIYAHTMITLLLALEQITNLDFFDNRDLTIAELKIGKSKAVSGIIALLIFSLAGIPPLPGFIAKFGIIMHAMEKDYYLLAISAILISLFILFYYLSIFKKIFFIKKDLDVEIVAIDISILSKILILFSALTIFLPTLRYLKYIEGIPKSDHLISIYDLSILFFKQSI